MTRLSLERLFSRTSARWVSAAVILTALLFLTPYRTVDRRGLPRMRTAVFVWQSVTPAAGLPERPPWVDTVYHVGLGVTIVGGFMLLWCAFRLRRSPGPPRSAVHRLTTSAAGMLNVDDASHVPARMLRWTIAALALFVAWRLGAFVLSQSDTLVSTDHPFHLARAETLRRSLLNGEVLRWIAHHQGGYPVEFYPLGFAWFEVLLWAVLLGLVSILVVHKLAVILLLIAPAFLFWYLARLDGRPPIVAVLAFAAHLAVPGSTWEGGFTELVTMGLVTNVSGALCALAAFAGLTAFVGRGEKPGFVVATLASAAALWTNPRSGLALAACGIGAWAAASVRSTAWKGAGLAALRVAAVGMAAALIAAPELLSLVRYGGLYYFIQYTGYENSMDYLAAAMNAVSTPVFGFAILGGWAALAAEDRPISRATAITLIAYVVMTATVSFNSSVAALVPQLEATRLMPFQRLLTLYLAAVGCHAAARVLTRGRQPAAADALQIGAAGALLVAFGIPFAVIAPAGRAFDQVMRSSTPEMSEFTNIVQVADRVTPPATAVLIVGSRVSTHQQLWAPLVRERPYFYDDWMWYWHTDHRGPFNPYRGSVYRPDRMREVFSREYLARHAIGSVLVSGRSAAVAAASSDLELVFSGSHSLYRVRNPVPFVTFGGTPADVTVSNHEIAARGTSPGGYAIIRRNWFPRWRATINGRDVPVERTQDGYMRVAAPAGAVELRLAYVVERADWAARGFATTGLLIVFGVLLRRVRA